LQLSFMCCMLCWVKISLPSSCLYFTSLSVCAFH
jgi:hypothetical protein